GIAEPAFAVVTVGGTNGKGSTVAHLAALLAALGASTGMFTSPHFIRYNERIRVNGAEVADQELIGAFERIEAARGAITLTFFEYNTLAALLIFAHRAVDVAVLEVGLGGRLDATNLVAADVGVLASVGFDHRDWLGDTLELIGAEKAGIFRPGKPAVPGTPDMPASVFARLAGRFQVVPGEVEWILDIAHNQPAAEVLARQLRERALPRARHGGGGPGRTFAVIGVLADKDAAAIGSALGALIDHWIVCALP